MTDEVFRAICAYKPKLKGTRWTRIAPFAQAVVGESLPRDVHDARMLLIATAGFVDWCFRVRRLPLDRTVLFRPALIDVYAERTARLRSAATAGNYRSRLNRVARHVNPGAMPASRPALPPSQGSAPYTATEESVLWAWARGQQDTHVQRDATLLLAACLGAGLTGRETCELRGHDIVIDVHGVRVRVSGSRAREVPVLSAYERAFVKASMITAADGFVFLPDRTETTKNTVSNFVARLTQGTAGFSTQRARATWVVRHLQRGVRIDALMTAMGVSDFSAIDRYTRYVTPIGDSDYQSLLRGHKDAA